MRTENFSRIKSIVTAVLEKDRREWPSALVEQCGDDVDLFLEATSLLALSRLVDDFIEAPAWRVLGSREGRDVASAASRDRCGP